MRTKNKILLPEGFGKTRFPYVSFKEGVGILEYCDHCTRNKNCKINSDLRIAMGNDFPYWSDKFIGVVIPSKTSCFLDVKVFCTDYKNPQLKLFKTPMGFSDGVERLIELIEREK